MGGVRGELHSYGRTTGKYSSVGASEGAAPKNQVITSKILRSYSKFLPATKELT